MSRLVSPDTGLRMEAEMPRGGGAGILGLISPAFPFAKISGARGRTPDEGENMYPKTCGVIATQLAVLALSAPAMANDHAADEPLVVVTASRFSEADSRVPANISIIGRDEIRTSPARDLPGLLKSRAGIDVRNLYGSQGVDATVDLRGFGESAGSNTLILLDGLRLNPIDLSAVSWSAIPLESVQRIEIIRGAGTVLYGDRASGGVINIITDKSGKSAASVTATLGSYDFRGLDAHAAGGSERLYGNVYAHYAATDGWRQNSKLEQISLSGRGGMSLEKGEVFVDYALYKDDSGLPGYVNSATYRQNPRFSRTPLDSQEREGYRLRPGVALPLGSTLRLEAEASLQHEDFRSSYVSFASEGKRASDTWSLTPRLKWQHGLGRLPSETVAGIDYYVGEIDAGYSSAPAQGAKQTSTSFYVQNQTSFEAWTLTLGDRQQRMAQSIYQKAYAPWFSPALAGNQTRSRNAWDAGLSYSGTGWRIYGKLGTTYRFASTDELFAYDPFTGNPVFAGNLKPQHGSLRELGGSLRLGSVSARLSVYRMNLQDEIGYDGNLFANVNFDPTRRQGSEVEIDWRIVAGFKARFAWSYTDAQFRSGPYAGKQLPLVARDKGSLQLNWDVGQYGQYTAQINRTGERPYSGDFANVRQKLAGYSTVDLMAAWNIKPWTVSMRLLNAFDKRYSAYAGYSTTIADYYYYPADGRTLFVSARYDFK